MPAARPARPRAPVLLLLGAALAIPAVPAHARATEATAAGEPRPLELRWRDGEIVAVAGALAIVLGAESARLTPAHCRICSPGSLDDEAREALQWRATGRAGHLSDLVANALLPASAAAVLLGSAWAAGEPREGLRDLVPIVEAILITTDLDLIVKDLSARARPSAADPRAAHGDQLHAFFSGHTSFAFALVVSSAEVASLRGYPTACWLWAVGLPLAAGVGYLRVAAGAHWLTDVLAGAAVGGAVGFGVPWVLHRPRHGSPVTLRLAPGGLALRF